jgi:Zn finger protein HypA/HybF involved in hydrogenase expression
MKIIRNAAKCRHCGKVIESTHVHDFRWHECAAGKDFAVDGGKCYLRRVGSPEDYEDVSEVIEDAPV